MKVLSAMLPLTLNTASYQDQYVNTSHPSGTTPYQHDLTADPLTATTATATTTTATTLLVGWPYTLTYTVAPLLKRYHNNVKCTKCGSAEYSVCFCCGAILLNSAVNGSQVNPGCDKTTYGKEHLHLGCKRCQYSWLMSPLDQIPEGEEASDGEL